MLQLTHRSRAIWLSCLSTSLRTATACSIVAVATLFGPASLRRHITFPAFSYVTVILIITGASLGDTLRGCRDAACATVLTIVPAILGFWVIGTSRLTTALTSVLVCVAAFVVVLPDEKTHLVSKRIALGQIVIVYVVAYDMGGETDPVMHPLHVAASTAVGVLACVVALVVPYPGLATWQVKKKCKLYADNASEMVNLCVKAFCAKDDTSAQAFVSQAKSLAIKGTKLLNVIKNKKESMKWETLPINFLKPYCMKTAEMLQDAELPIQGMLIALQNIHSFPSQILDQDLNHHLHKLEENITQTFDKLKSCMPFELATFPVSSDLENLMPSLHSFPQTHKDLPSFFFLFCSKLLQTNISNNSPLTNPDPSSIAQPPNKKIQKEGLFERISAFVMQRRFMVALKCSLSVGFAVLLGLIYSKENGIWSGLPVAISFAASREAVFRVSNLKAQGTVLGTVYGVLGCFILEKYVKVRFLILLPWFVFCSLIKKSRMYGPAGGVSAVIGAVLILGREHFGSPTEFAIIRIVEAFIGLSCSIIVEIMFRPTRASTLAKIQLSKSLRVLNECICMVSHRGQRECLGGGLKKVKANVNELRKFIEEAEMEPNFWFVPFNGVCYNKLLKSLSNMEGLLVFLSHANAYLQQESMSLNKLEDEVELFKEMIQPSIKCFERVVLVKSLNKLEKELQKSNACDTSSDLELGKLPIISPYKLYIYGANGEDEIDNVIDSYITKSNEIVFGEGHEELKGHDVGLSLSAFAFCLRGLVRETREIEKGVMELVQWENPSSHVNLYEIAFKIDALCNI